MQLLKKELYQGLIHFRDRHQFELKSEFLHIPGVPTIDYSQEFYLFIPEALQINSSTYPKKQFYRDQTNFIRFKTPIFTFSELLESSRSPLSRLRRLCNTEHSEEKKGAIQDEVKLLGNVVRSALRERVRQLIDQLEAVQNRESATAAAEGIDQLVEETTNIQQEVLTLHSEFMEHWEDSMLRQHISYVSQFIAATIDFHLTGLLKAVRKAKHNELAKADAALCALIAEQKPLKTGESGKKEERFHYRRGLLNKFILGALRLRIHRRFLIERYHNIIAMTAAAIAMLIFLIGVALQGGVFILNSTPFILVTTLLYVVKDRIKDGIKAVYHEKAALWLPDYITEIFTPSGAYKIGRLREVFSYLEPSHLPEMVEKVRNRDFHDVLESFRRPETIMYYKTQVHLGQISKQEMRRYDLNTIFRFNIHRFLEKACDPYASYTTLDTGTGELQKLDLPKVYHINIIVRNTFTSAKGKPREQLQKFRLVIDKEGIKRVEQIWGQEK